MPPAPRLPGDTPGQGSAANGEPRFTDWLREQSEPTWTQAVEHRFTFLRAGFSTHETAGT